MEPQKKPLEDRYDIRRLTTESFEEVWDFVSKYFLPMEPMCSTLQVDKEEGYMLVGEALKAGCEQEVSIGAYDKTTEKLVGVRISLLGKKSNDHIIRIPNDSPLKVKQVLETLNFMVCGDISSCLGTTDYMEFFLVCCHPNHAKRGIASGLYERSIQIAKEEGVKKAFTIATSHYTQSITKKLGFVRSRHILYKEYVDPCSGKKIYENMPSPHVLISLEIKDLENLNSF